MLPAGPRKGEATRPIAPSPFAIAKPIVRRSTSRWISSSRTTPPLPISSRPASNCGLISGTQAPPGRSRRATTGKINSSEMNDTSITTRSTGSVSDSNFLSGLVREAGPAMGGGHGLNDAGADLSVISGGSAPVVRMVGSVVERAVEEGASDIHLESQPEEMLVRYRIDGVLRTVAAIPSALSREVVSRIKVMAEMDIAERRVPQDGRVSLTAAGHRLDLRVVTVPTVHGEGVVIRILDTSNAMRKLSELGFAPDSLERFQSCYRRPYGAVLVSGPTGSGKSTTLYGALHNLNTGDRKIITVEDPVEYVMDGIIQCSIDAPAGRDFPNTLREVVRQDPDVIVVGEIRDRATAAIAIETALTGHKVFATFHTEDSIGSLVRLIDMNIEAFLISSTVVSVMAQRLLRRVCSQCAEPYTPTATEIRRLGVMPADLRGSTFKAGKGCPHCRFTGYRGRICVFELLVLNEVVKDAILNRRTSYEIRRVSVETSGLVALLEDGLYKASYGLTSIQEVLRHLPRVVKPRPVEEIRRLLGSVS